MREIKFRVWAKEVKEMVMFNLTHDFTLFREDVQKTVMQYTGLHDKNGVEIYEGDIVNIKYWTDADNWEYRIAEVQFLEQSAKYMAVNDKEENAYESNDMTSGEIIGNIYENPELLKS